MSKIEGVEGRQRQWSGLTDWLTGCLTILFNSSLASCIHLHTVGLCYNLYLRCDYNKPCLCWTINCLYFQIHGLGFWESLIIIFIDWDWEAREQKLYFSKFRSEEKWSEVKWLILLSTIFSPYIITGGLALCERDRMRQTISKIFPQCSIFRLISASRKTGRIEAPGLSLSPFPFLGFLTFFFGRISESIYDSDLK